MRIIRRTRTVLGALALATTFCAYAQSEGRPWIGTWTAAPAHLSRPAHPGLAPDFVGITVRQYLFTSIGGDAARLHFSNQYGTTPLTIANVRVGFPDGAGNIIQGSDVGATFGGNASITIPAGGTVMSDPVHIAVPAQGYLAVSTYFAGNVPVNDVTAHVFSSQDNQFGSGDQTAAPVMSNPTWFEEYFFLTGVDVQSTDAIGAVAAIGASFTDGFESPPDANRRWSNVVAARLATQGLKVGVLNQGLSGTDLLVDQELYGDGTVHRFDRDVLSQPGIRWAIVGEFNDLGAGNGDDLITALSSLVSQGHDRNVRLVCATFPPVYAEGDVEATRQRYNAFVRSAGSGCDAVFDEDQILRDPDKQNYPLPQYQRPRDANGNIVDIHPTDAGYQALGNGLDLGIFSQATPVAADLPSTDCVQGWTQGETLHVGTLSSSCDGRFALTLQSEGNLALYQGTTPLWTSGTNGRPLIQGQMLPTGNFVLYDVSGRPLWATNTDGHPGSHLLLQNDGNLVIYDHDNAPVWNTGTQR